MLARENRGNVFVQKGLKISATSFKKKLLDITRKRSNQISLIFFICCCFLFNLIYFCLHFVSYTKYSVSLCSKRKNQLFSLYLFIFASGFASFPFAKKRNGNWYRPFKGMAVAFLFFISHSKYLFFIYYGSDTHLTQHSPSSLEKVSCRFFNKINVRPPSRDCPSKIF